MNNSRFNFIIRLSIKNILHSKFRSSILLVSFTILALLSTLVFTSKTFVKEYFYNEKTIVYNDLDFYLTYDQNTNARFFSIRELKNQIDCEKEFIYIAPFFQLNSVMESSNGTLEYVETLASDIETLKKVTRLSDEVTELKSNEIIITHSISNEYRIEKGETLNLLFGERKIPYIVVDIIEDNGLLRENRVFIDKDSNIKLVAEQLGFSDISPLFTKNLYNYVYFSLRDDSKSEVLKQTILEIPQYENYVINDTLNIKVINESIDRVYAILILIFIFILFSIVLVLQSTLIIVFEDRKAQIGVIKSLGGRYPFYSLVIVSEMLIFFIVSAVLGIGICFIILNIGLWFMGSELLYFIPFSHILLSLILVFLLIMIISIINLFRMIRVSTIKLSLAEKQVKENRSIINFPLLGLTIILFYLNNFILMKYSLELKSLINVIISLAFLFLFSRCLLILISLYGRLRKKKSLFSLCFLKNLNNRKIINPIINVLLMSLLLIVMLIGTRDYVIKQAKGAKDFITIDYGLTNLINNVERTYSDLQNDTRVKNVDLGYYYNNVKIEELNTYFWFTVAINPLFINNYFEVEMEQDIIAKLQSVDTPYVVLPMKYKYTSNIKIDDTIHLNISKLYSNEKFIVAGFAEMEISDLLITNIQVCSKFQEVKPNIIFLKYFEEQKLMKHELIEQFYQEMYFVIDFEALLDIQTTKMMKLTDYVAYIIIVLVICFVLTEFNYLELEFTKRVPVFSRLRVIGCSNKLLIANLLLEKLVILLTLLLSVITVIPIIFKNFPFLLIFFGDYQKIEITTLSVISALIIGIIMYLISILVYLYKIKSIKIAEITKIY